jgi:hypothetical protein
MFRRSFAIAASAVVVFGVLGTATAAHAVAAPAAAPALAAAAPAHPCPSYPPGMCKFTVSPSSGVGHANVTVTVENYTPACAVKILFDGVQISTAGTSATGSRAKVVTIPTGAAPGNHTIRAVDCSGFSQTRIFFVNTPRFTFKPNHGTAGSNVTLYGTALQANCKITWAFDGVTQPTSAMTGPAGNFSKVFQIPATATPGKHTIRITDTCSNKKYGATNNYKVEGAITAALTTPIAESSMGGAGTALIIGGVASLLIGRRRRLARQ